MNDWIFQCNPKRFDLEGALAQGLQKDWNTPTQRSQIFAGGRVGLLSGEDLVTLCLERGIGVTTRRLVLYELDPSGLRPGEDEAER